jgi:hypothetical protein
MVLVMTPEKMAQDLGQKATGGADLLFHLRGRASFGG